MNAQGCLPLAQLQVLRLDTKVIGATRDPHKPSPCPNKIPPSQIASVPSSYTHTNFINVAHECFSLDAPGEVSAAAKRMLVSSVGGVSLIALGTMTLNTPRTILPYSLKRPQARY